MPFTLCLANFSNSVCWVVYAVIVVDVWVLIPNVFGCVLTAIQLALYVIYPTSKSTETQLESVTIGQCGPITDYDHEASISVVITTNTQEGQALARKSSFDRKDSVDFVAIRSPMTRQLSSISRH
ncbi:hypothetical protein PR003_g32050 [Phytophthora rubi]|uniref:Bidirectional sugar transporter SWEET n=1 Tax=Phytophthora rubi TaxID=129364 RepID=A0A6A4B268_9STRA|nr:hypothetical protein PR002_g30818 [Phytophthora rubi]KAE8958749.1 hypothetical protein PR001_g30954 [Phytophthora rubi]KAE9266653.1 hypothetical protein PR003_g32050 [Phytophthora rubi]